MVKSSVTTLHTMDRHIEEKEAGHVTRAIWLLNVWQIAMDFL